MLFTFTELDLTRKKYLQRIQFTSKYKYFTYFLPYFTYHFLILISYLTIQKRRSSAKPGGPVAKIQKSVSTFSCFTLISDGTYPTPTVITEPPFYHRTLKKMMTMKMMTTGRLPLMQTPPVTRRMTKMRRRRM